jgi:hypothetical protein
MRKIQRKFIDSCLLIMLLSTLLFLVSASAQAQETANSEGSEGQIATKINSAGMAQPGKGALAAAPVYKDFMGVTLGMEADEVRQKLGHLKVKGERQDFFVFSDSQSAQIGYDHQGRVTVISVDYGSGDEAPSAEAVLGEAAQAKPDGSIYQLKRYPAEGYWVAYSRTSGERPTVTVTMQKF